MQWRMIKKGLLILPALLFLAACVAMPLESATPSSEPIPTVTATPAPPPVEMVTPDPIPTPTVATLAVCGDAMVHIGVSQFARDGETGAYDYSPIFAQAIPYLAAADYALCNLETPLAGGAPSGYPRFNGDDALAQNLKDAGFDLCLTANNHCLDQGHKGLLRTLDVLDGVGLAHVGTSRTQEEQDNNVVLADVGGISVAFLGYTYGTNALALPADAPYAANVYYTDYMTTLSHPDYDFLLEGLEQAKALEPDLIAVLIHWGTEYKLTSTRAQEEVADFLFENGADLVLGGHPHVIEPMGFRALPDGRQGFLSYSLGNFFSGQTKENTDVTALLSLELSKDPVTGVAQVTGCSYTPFLMVRSGYELMDVYASLTAGVEDPDLEERLWGAIDLCHQVLGEEFDPLSGSLPRPAVTEAAPEIPKI